MNWNRLNLCLMAFVLLFDSNSMNNSGLYGSYLVRVRTIKLPRAPGSSDGFAKVLRINTEQALSGLDGFLSREIGTQNSQTMGPGSAVSQKVKSYEKFWLVPAAKVSCRHDFVDELRNHPDVLEIVPDEPVLLSVPDSQAITHSSRLPTMALNGYGKGRGIRIGVIDSGIVAHPVFGNRIRAYQDFTQNPVGSMTDTVGHGSFVASLVAGAEYQGKTLSFAPESELIVARALEVISGAGTDQEVSSRVMAFASRILQAMQWMLDPDGNSDTEDYPQVMINSWGFSEKMPVAMTFFDEAISAWREAGIIVLFAAGNEGQKGSGTVRYPGTSPNVITIGSINDTHQISRFSSIGTAAGSKPDFVFYGENLDGLGKFRNQIELGKMSGTSMATPLVGGLIALMLEKDPSLTQEKIHDRLKSSALDLGNPGWDPAFGFGLVQLTNPIDNGVLKVGTELVSVLSQCLEEKQDSQACEDIRTRITSYVREMAEAGLWVKIQKFKAEFEQHPKVQSDLKLHQSLRQILNFYRTEDGSGAAAGVYRSLYAH